MTDPCSSHEQRQSDGTGPAALGFPGASLVPPRDPGAPSGERSGTIFGLTAYVLWGGLFPLYWPLLAAAQPVEVLAHRIAWSLAVLVALLSVRRRWDWIRRYARQPRLLGFLALAALTIAGNWWTYIYGSHTGHVVELSLGFFTAPLVTVLLGVLVLRERLRPAQWVAVALTGVAVLVLTIDYGRLPWIALLLAFSFAVYGLIKKRTGTGAVESLTVESAILVLPAIGYLGWIHTHGVAPAGAALAAPSAVSRCRTHSY